MKPDRWADWHAPASLLHRIRLEWLRLWPDLPEAGSGQTPEEQLAGWLRDLAAGKALDQIDGERLASAALARLLDLEPVPADLLDDLEKAYRYDPARQPVCLAHRPTPPLFLALARGRLALGDPARGESCCSQSRVGHRQRQGRAQRRRCPAGTGRDRPPHPRRRAGAAPGGRPGNAGLAARRCMGPGCADRRAG